MGGTQALSHDDCYGELIVEASGGLVSKVWKGS